MKLTNTGLLKSRAYRVAIYFLLTTLSMIFILPLLFALLSSFKASTDIFAAPFALPKQWMFANYSKAWEAAHFNRYFTNTVFLTLASMVVTAVIGLMGSYILAKYRFRLNSTLYLFFIAGLMVPIQITIIPLAYVFGSFGLKDNYGAIILLFAAFNIPMTTLILTGFIKDVPAELEEAAIIDGCGPWRIVFTIITPVVTPALASASIFNFIAAWNNLLIPLIFISKDELKTIPIGLLAFNGQYSSDYGGLMAAIVISIAVPIAIYLLLQERVEGGLTAGAVKG